jgi:hypothetical protein
MKNQTRCEAGMRVEAKLPMIATASSRLGLFRCCMKDSARSLH